MKKTLIFAMLCVVSLLAISCNDDYDGIATPLKLNIHTYNFPKEGGMLKIHSTDKRQIMIAPTCEDGKSETTQYWDKRVWSDVFEANVYFDKRDTLFLEVYPNTTGQEREIGLRIFSGNAVCNTSFTQSGE